MRLTPILLSAFGCSAFLFSQQTLATSVNELKAIIECRTNSDGYQAFADDYENELKNLGWKRQDDPNQPFIYIYKNSTPIKVFDKSTTEIGLTGQAVVAIYRYREVEPLAKKYGFTQHPALVDFNYFRGEKLIETEPATEDSFTIHKKLMLSELPGKSPMSILGCNYEPDRAEMENLLNFAE
jgi:hypothetical protein